MTWIHEQPDWPDFTWDANVLASRLGDRRHRQGRLLGRMESRGFELRREASLETLTTDVVTSCAIEGVSIVAWGIGLDMQRSGPCAGEDGP